MRYISSPDFHRDGAERIGILLVNSGTPAAPEAGEVRKFLAKFLGDPRVVEIPRVLWLRLWCKPKASWVHQRQCLSRCSKYPGRRSMACIFIATSLLAAMIAARFRRNPIF